MAMNNLTTQILAIIGAVTGISSLLVQFFTYRLYRPRLKIEIDKSESFFFEVSDNPSPKILDSFEKSIIISGAFITLNISNISIYPVTITGIDVYQKEKYTPTMDFARNELIFDYHGSKLTCFFKETMKKHFRLNLYDTKSGLLKIPLFREITEEELAFTIIVKTPEKSFVKEIIVRRLSKTYPLLLR